jgi:hypothetical protein
MAYIGTSPSNGVRRRFVYEATASQTSFSGSDENGVTLTYVDSLYLDVFQNGIKLKAGDDYTATTGTSVVLVQGASANDVVEMVAFDIFSVGDTVSAKDGGNFAGNVAMAGTLSVTGGIVSPVTINGTTPTLTIGDAGAEDAKIVFDGNAEDYHIGLDDSADVLVIGKGSALGTTTAMSFDANGAVTMPLQPAFHVYFTENQNDTPINASTTIAWTHERFDQADNFASNTFTAPVTGKYQLNLFMSFGQMDIDYDFVVLNIVTSNRSYTSLMAPNGFDADPVYWNMALGVLADMDAGDTAYIIVQLPNSGAAQMDRLHDYSSFSGYLVC